MLFYVVLNLLFVAGEQDSFTGYCDISSNSCDIDNNSFNDKKYIFYDVNPSEGFNLRRDVYMRFAIMLAEARKNGKRKNWELVLPPWHRLYHWKSERRSKPKPWSAFFDINSLRTYAPVVELHELFNSSLWKALEIDIVYVLQNFEDPFENGIFEDKWEINDACEYEGYWGYNKITAKEVICVKFQGKITMLWEIIALHPKIKKIMFAHGEIPLHETYGTRAYWDCRKSMKFNNKLLTLAKNYISTNLNCNIDLCTTYISVHWRRQDFARYRSKDVPSIPGTAKQINAVAKANTIRTVFISTDASKLEIAKLENELKQLDLQAHIYEPSQVDLEKYGDGGVAIIDQIICSHSSYFIGTHESTFSFRIQEEREILGFKSNTTFNRLCPDIGKCERPSKWTIV